MNEILKRYCQSVVDVVSEKKSSEDSWKNFLLALKVLTGKNVYSQLLSRSLPSNKKEEIVFDILSDFTFKEAKNLIKIISKNNRWAMMGDIYDGFLALQNTARGCLSVSCIQPENTNEKIKKKVLEEINAVNSKYLVDFIEDSSVTAGAVLKLGDRVIDASLDGAIQRFYAHCSVKGGV